MVCLDTFGIPRQVLLHRVSDAWRGGGEYMHLLHAIIQYRSSVGFKSPVVIRGEGVVDVIGYFRVTRILPKIACKRCMPPLSSETPWVM